MNPDNEFDVIAKAISDISKSVTGSAPPHADEIRRILESLAAKAVQSYSLPEKPEPPKQPEKIIESYVVPKGTDILLPKEVLGKTTLNVLDFDSITTTRSVKYDPGELVYDGTTGFADLPVNIGPWAEHVLGFRLPPNDKQVTFFLVLKRWVDIKVKTEYIPTSPDKY